MISGIMHSQTSQTLLNISKQQIFSYKKNNLTKQVKERQNQTEIKYLKDRKKSEIEFFSKFLTKKIKKNM